ncbi:13298_t:CDS:2 [Gigaspora rosea]|nr:13298_t:CDS:2 [Gigaspora rosea]
MDVDEVYLIDFLQWRNSTMGLGFEEEINYNIPGMENTSFTWNQTCLSSHIDVNPEEWAQPFDEHTDWETYDSVRIGIEKDKQEEVNERDQNDQKSRKRLDTLNKRKGH